MAAETLPATGTISACRRLQRISVNADYAAWWLVGCPQKTSTPGTQKSMVVLWERGRSELVWTFSGSEFACFVERFEQVPLQGQQKDMKLNSWFPCQGSQKNEYAGRLTTAALPQRPGAPKGFSAWRQVTAVRRQRTPGSGCSYGTAGHTEIKPGFAAVRGSSPRPSPAWLGAATAKAAAGAAASCLI